MNYRAIMVAEEPNDGILFAKRLDSEFSSFAALGKEIVRLLHDFEGNVILSTGTDEYENPVLYASYGEEGKSRLIYTLIFEEEEK